MFLISHHNHSLLLAVDSGILTDEQQQTTLEGLTIINENRQQTLDNQQPTTELL
jgi:hypothetical protein